MRAPRFHVPDVVHHVIARFVNEEFIISNAHLRAEYLRRVCLAVARSSWRLLAYAIMSSHVHLALLAGVEPLARWIMGAHSGFANWLNRNGRRQGARTRGPVFADRPKTVLLEGERVAYLLAYIHNNPVRAGVVQDASDSDWTSHRAYVAAAPAPACLDVELGLSLAGFAPDPDGRRQFDLLVRAHRDARRDPDLTAVRSARLRAAVRWKVGRTVELARPVAGAGGLHFQVVRPSGLNPQRTFSGSAEELVEVVARVGGVAVSSIRRGHRSLPVSRARRLAIRAWHLLGRRLCEISRATGVSSAAASNVLARSGPSAAEDSEVEQVLLAVGEVKL